MALRPETIVAVCLLAGCVHQAADDDLEQPTESTGAHVKSTPPDGTYRAQQNGRAFPEGVLALTWDDGPDLHTLALAEYLQREHVPATFFVVGEWNRASSDPGYGDHVRDTGLKRMPILSELVARGHRIGNHTMHHVLLGHADGPTVVRELDGLQRALDPFIHDEVRLFRVPGGDWNGAASRAVDGDDLLSKLTGPIRWDIDAKDWEGSVWCESHHPASECERASGRSHVRPEIMAQRYEADIESARRGIVLMHDRVGDVGSDYALEMARILVPRLVARGYVFAAPVLGFSAMRTRAPVATCAGLRVADVNGDGRGDACVRDHDRVTCALSTGRPDEHGLDHAVFDGVHPETLLPPSTTSFELADVRGSGRADVCAQTSSGIDCDLEGELQHWTHEMGDAKDLHFADLDGDGKSDVCGVIGNNVVCARSTGSSFEPAHVWLPGVGGPFALGDVTGDGRADLCVGTSDGVECAPSGHMGFGHLARWSHEPMTSLALGDVNGDGRADVCVPTGGGVRCALSNGRTFLHTSSWLDTGLDAEGSVRAEWARLGDINGDGRLDLCECNGNDVRCAVAP